MILRYTLLLLLFVSTVVTLAQDDVKGIYWSSNYKLKWADFKGKPLSDKYKAGCAAALTAEGYWDGLPNFIVTNYFRRDVSWTVDSVSQVLLEHEQLHFDLAEVHARRIRKSIDSLRALDIDKIDKYTFIINAHLNHRNTIDSKYDQETNHSLNQTKQKKWEMLVYTELKELEKYAVEE